jgi:signal recognition particle subunit SRP54
VFATLSDRLSATFKSLRGKGRLSEADVDRTISEIRRALLDADVAVPAVRAFTSAVREEALAADLSKALNPGQQVIKIVHAQLVEILGGESRELALAKRPPTVIMLAGLQGAGKTTLAGKLGRWLREQGHTPLLVASDLQRPNAVTQLQVVGGQAGVPVWAPEPGSGVGDPVAVARSGVEHARSTYYDVVVVDTAGRLGVDAEMMQQAADIRDAVQPDETLFVVDAMIGQDAVTTAEAFRDGVGFTGVVLSKLDGDARGGAALSIRTVTGRPVLFASTGEKLTDFERFHPDRMASRILDMGDLLTLIEQTEKAFDERQTAEMGRKLSGEDDFTLQDFMDYMRQLKQLGSMKKMLGMMPGMGQMREQLENFDEREVDRVEAMINSMTPAERATPKMINGSRRSRIARGSGVTTADVNGLLDRFEQAKTMMRSMARQGGKGGAGPMMGMGGLPGGGKKSRGRMAPPKKTKKGKSGNPAKRAQQEREAAQRADATAAPGSAFGGVGGQAPVDPASVKLPSGFDQLFGR